jgi:excisionase family DNA binding protein
MQKLLNLNEAADVLGYSVSGLRKLIRANRGPRYTRAGQRGQFRFKQEWLEEFVEQGATPVKPLRVRPKIKSQFGFDPALLDL